MSTPDTPCTLGQNVIYQGENHTHALFRIEPGIRCQHAREEASELMGCARDLTLESLMEDKPKLIWAAQYLCALGKALLDDAELGLMR
ncbi:DUF3077 domain-containing protein [Pseudomonas fulva]|uniref:DUF3077 domain-containing protein n=1 Tax=Pseudomonas fulva TaxID=47880 RepID=UPI0018ABFD3E|nr:DUF3077 domain-containing protein [Pseudomonas fulva]MBF8678596.1 DUF3077 domain-containing protein [Pseudomonas fulva]MBF8717007.1 DUF3077 domain-containing protein [Pseudomonas fulva]MBF8782552.1 DUF3077 domain-containing protein [Pseudomonas fulva]